MTAKITPTHGSFTLERNYAQPPAAVFSAIADADARRRWLVEGEGFEVEFFRPDFTVGKFDRSGFRFQGGPLITNDTVYLDILEGRRITFAYTMTLDGTPMSSSLVTVTLEAIGPGTRLTLTEQGAYLPGFDDIPGREHGTRELLKALGREIDRRAQAA